MACRTGIDDNGVLYWMCGPAFEGSSTCRVCGHLATKLCDYPVGDGKTCDSALCDHHTLSPAGDIDYCPEHAKEYGLYQPQTKPIFLKRGENDNYPFTDKPPPKRRKRLPRRAA